MWSANFVDVPLAVSPIGEKLLDPIGWGDRDISSDEWEDVDLDAEEMNVNAARPWKEELG